jgi:hypothetical protein
MFKYLYLPNQETKCTLNIVFITYEHAIHIKLHQQMELLTDLEAPQRDAKDHFHTVSTCMHSTPTSLHPISSLLILDMHRAKN